MYWEGKSNENMELQQAGIDLAIAVLIVIGVIGVGACCCIDWQALRQLQEPTVAAQQAPTYLVDEATMRLNRERQKKFEEQILAAYAERRGFAQPSAVGSSELPLPRNVEQPSAFERFERRFREMRAAEKRKEGLDNHPGNVSDSNSEFSI